MTDIYFVKHDDRREPDVIEASHVEFMQRLGTKVRFSDGTEFTTAELHAREAAAATQGENG